MSLGGGNGDLTYTHTPQANSISCCHAQINLPSTDKRSTVIDPNSDTPLVGGVAHTYFGSKWKRAVRCSQTVHVVDLTVSGASTVIRMSIPRSKRSESKCQSKHCQKAKDVYIAYASTHHHSQMVSLFRTQDWIAQAFQLHPDGMPGHCHIEDQT